MSETPIVPSKPTTSIVVYEATSFVTSKSPQVDAPTAYGLKDAQLAGIIQATDDALAQIRTLRCTVVDTSGAVYRANQSRSGKILEARFNDWASEFGQIEANLTRLNERVKTLRQIMLRVADEADSQASH